MAADELPLDDKAKRMRDLLSSFYSPEPSLAASASAKSASLDAINSTSFDPDLYMNLLVQKSNLEGLLQKHVEMAAEIKNLDTDLQMLVYENYNKFISATDTIKRMKNNIVGMEANMEQLLEKFIYDLPTRLGKCIKSEAYADAVRFYTGAMPIFKAYGESSFQDCKRASEEAIGIIINNLQVKLYSDSEPVAARADAVVLLKQLDFPVDSLKTKLLEKLQHFLSEFQIESREAETILSNPDEPFKAGGFSDSVPSIPPEASTNQVSIGDFSESVRAYRIIFPDSESRLIELAQALFTKRFETIQQRMKKKVSSADLLVMLRGIWTDVTLMDEVLPEAALPTFSLEAARAAIKQFVSSSFSHLLLEVSDALAKVKTKSKEGLEELSLLQVALESGKKAVIQGSMDLLLGFRQLLDDGLELLVKLRDLIIDWVQEGFQDFFSSLDDRFHLLSGSNTSANQDPSSMDGRQADKVLTGLVLVLAQLSIFIEQSAIPRITEEIAASFSGGGMRGYEYGPAFVPGEICRIFRYAGEKFLHLYIHMKTQKISIILKKRFTTPNWIKHKEPREVHMFVDILLQELEAIGTEVNQILPRGLVRKHRRSDSAGSTASIRSNPIREDKMARTNTQRARSQLLESHLAKLFKQKMEIFTKVEHTQESVVSTIVKLCLKSLQEFVRLQTFNRSGFQQIQVDIQFLRNPLKENVDDEAAIDFLLDEVIVAAAERCLDPIALEPAILDKLIQAKLAKRKEQKPSH
ncbi:vacuolar protein sorting-associated protein 51 homolog isoform X2 [Magnolia sinica]|uniref:vacuolar protein sorting-associated protein 51 homolog isoform X2 n=1 Tax=Magnolia sinica TaxID=86752 RepID=UPI002657C23D|nr:vacuolar protein sorting-associated protein 51 homolog isoform X2 [Magnolia sinica]